MSATRRLPPPFKEPHPPPHTHKNTQFVLHSPVPSSIKISLYCDQHQQVFLETRRSRGGGRDCLCVCACGKGEGHRRVALEVALAMMSRLANILSPNIGLARYKCHQGPRKWTYTGVNNALSDQTCHSIFGRIAFDLIC